MEYNHQKGDTVICINSKGAGGSSLTCGKEYIVQSTGAFTRVIDDAGIVGGYYHWRFEKKQPVPPARVAIRAPNRALRFNDGKLQWSLVDFSALESMVRVLEKGAEKYTVTDTEGKITTDGRNNWKNGQYTTKIMESLMRHALAVMRGEIYDKETGESHLGHIMCNAMFAEWMRVNKPECNDLPIRPRDTGKL